MESQIKPNDVHKKSNGKTSANGFHQSETFDELVNAKQKLLIAEKNAQQTNSIKADKVNLNSNNNNNDNYSNDDSNEIYGDAYTHPNTQHSKFATTHSKVATKFLNNKNNNEPVQVFSDDQDQSSFAHTVQDQFAGALLRLQTSLDKTDKRIASIETRLNEFARQTAHRQQPKASKGRLSQHLSTIAFFGWPIVVFLAMRALERRSLTTKS